MKRIFYLVCFLTLLICCSCSSVKNEKSSEDMYQDAKNMLEEKKYQEAYEQFLSLGEYEDSKGLAGQSGYLFVREQMTDGNYEEAISILEKSNCIDKKDELILECKYYQVIDYINANDYVNARALIGKMRESVDVLELEMQCNYSQGIMEFKEKNYIEAAEQLLEVTDYLDANEYLVKTAKKLLVKKKYAKSQEICNVLKGNKEVAKLKKKISFALKYAMFKQGVEDGQMLVGDMQYLTAEETEQVLSELFYGGWTEYSTGELLYIDKYNRNDEAYGIYTATYDSGWYTIFYYYQDAPEKIYSEYWHEVSVPGGQSQPFLESYKAEGYEYEEYAYTKMSQADLWKYAEEVQAQDNATENPLKDLETSANDEDTSNVLAADETELIAIASANIGLAIEDTVYSRYAAGAYIKDCMGVSKALYGYKVTFRVFFPEQNGTKFVYVYLTQNMVTGEYEFSKGSS